MSQFFCSVTLSFCLYPHNLFQIHPAGTAFQPSESVLFFHDLVYPDRADHHPAVTLCRSCPDRDVRFCYLYFIRNFSRCIQLFPVFVKNTVACVLVCTLFCFLPGCGTLRSGSSCPSRICGHGTRFPLYPAGYRRYCLACPVRIS